MSSNRHRLISGYKFLLWQGWTGEWFWQVDDIRLNTDRVVDGSASSEQSAVNAAASYVSKCKGIHHVRDH